MKLLITHLYLSSCYFQFISFKYRHSDTPRLKKILTYAILEQNKNWNNIFEKRDEFLLAQRKTRWDKDRGRILLGENTDGGAVKLRPIRSQCVWSFGCQLYSPVYWPHIHSIPTCDGNSWTSMSGSVCLVLSAVFCCYNGDRPRSV